MPPMPLAKLVKGRNDKNKNVNITSVGLPGSGKSYGNIRVLQQLNDLEPKDESVLDFIYFNGREFVRDLKKPRSQYESRLLDDAGFSVAGREWWKSDNIDFVKEIQVARVGRSNILISTPHPRLVDSGLSAITHLMISLDYWKNSIYGQGYIRKHVIELSDKGIRDYWKYYDKIKFSLLDEDIAMAYEEKKGQELRKQKQLLPGKNKNELFNMLHYMNGLSWKDLEIMVVERNGQSKPFSYRRLATVVGWKKSKISEFIRDNVHVLKS